MSGVCSKHQGYDPECSICFVCGPDPEEDMRDHTRSISDELIQQGIVIEKFLERDVQSSKRIASLEAQVRELLEYKEKYEAVVLRCRGQRNHACFCGAHLSQTM